MPARGPQHGGLARTQTLGEAETRDAGSRCPWGVSRERVSADVNRGPKPVRGRRNVSRVRELEVCPGLSYRKVVTLVQATRRSREGRKQWVEGKLEMRKEDSKWRQVFREAAKGKRETVVAGQEDRRSLGGTSCGERLGNRRGSLVAGGKTRVTGAEDTPFFATWGADAPWDPNLKGHLTASVPW